MCPERCEFSLPSQCFRGCCSRKVPAWPPLCHLRDFPSLLGVLSGRSPPGSLPSTPTVSTPRAAGSLRASAPAASPAWGIIAPTRCAPPPAAFPDAPRSGPPPSLSAVTLLYVCLSLPHRLPWLLSPLSPARAPPGQESAVLHLDLKTVRRGDPCPPSDPSDLGVVALTARTAAWDRIWEQGHCRGSDVEVRSRVGP